MGEQQMCRKGRTTYAGELMKIPKFEPGTRLACTWLDAHSASIYWNLPDEIIPIEPIQTLGHYVSHDEDYFTVAQSWGSGDPGEIDGFGGCLSIPIGTIREIIEI